MTKKQKIVYYVLLFLISVSFLFSGYSKLTANPMAVAGFVTAHLPIWFMYFIGVAEVLGAIGLWIPKLSRLAAYGLMIILVGAIVTTAIFMSIAMATIPLGHAVVLFILLKLGNKRTMMVPPVVQAQ